MQTSFRLFAAGSNAQGQLGNGTDEDSHIFQACLLPPNLASSNIVDLATGANHTVALVEDHLGKRKLWGCGDGRAGQLGSDIIRRGNVTEFQELTLGEQFEGYEGSKVAASWQTTYIVLSSGDNTGDLVLSMGSNDYGDLGSKHIGAVHNGPNVVEFDELLGDTPFIVQHISAGQHHVILSLLLESQTMVVGWGASRHGQLGADPSILLPNGKMPLYIDHPIPIPVDTSNPIIGIALGSQHSLLLHASGQITGLGTNRKGQIDDALKRLEGVKSIGCTWNGSYAVGSDSSVVAYGANARGQLGQSSTSLADARVQLPFDASSQDSVTIACGSEHVLALHKGAVWGWGWNEHGNLGVGSTEDVVLPVEIWPSTETKVVGIWAGLGTSWIALSSR